MPLTISLIKRQVRDEIEQRTTNESLGADNSRTRLPCPPQNRHIHRKVVLISLRKLELRPDQFDRKNHPDQNHLIISGYRNRCPPRAEAGRGEGKAGPDVNDVAYRPNYAIPGFIPNGNECGLLGPPPGYTIISL